MRGYGCKQNLVSWPQCHYTWYLLEAQQAEFKPLLMTDLFSYFAEMVSYVLVTLY